jgi:hypothetical protein
MVAASDMVSGAAWSQHPTVLAAPMAKVDATEPKPNSIGPESTSATCRRQSRGSRPRRRGRVRRQTGGCPSFRNRGPPGESGLSGRRPGRQEGLAASSVGR